MGSPTSFGGVISTGNNTIDNFNFAVPQLQTNFGNGISKNTNTVANTLNNLTNITGATGYGIGGNLLSNALTSSSGITGNSGFGIGNVKALNNNFVRASNAVDPTVSNNFGLNIGNLLNNKKTSSIADGLNDMSDGWANILGGPGSKYYETMANNQKLALENQQSATTWNNWTNAFGLGLSALSGLGSYLNGKKYLALAKENMQNQMDVWNETYNNQLKQYNTALADRLRARAAFETGDSTAYNEEITNNSMSRGHTTAASSDYLNYKRSSNADNPYSKKETNPDQ